MEGRMPAVTRTFPQKTGTSMLFRRSSGRGRFHSPKKQNQRFLNSHANSNNADGGRTEVQTLHDHVSRISFDNVSQEVSDIVAEFEVPQKTWLNRNKQRLDNEASKRGRYQISYVSKLEKNILEDGDSDKNQKPLKDVDESSDEEKLEYVKHEEHDKDSLVSDFNSEHCKAELDIVQFREEIANVPLCKAKQLQEKLGQKLFDKAFFGESSICSSSKQTARRTFTRENSKRPREVSSKIPVSKFRNVFQNEKLGRPILDPRFDDRCGEFNDYIYHNNYDFLNDIRQQEKKILIEELKRVKREGGGDLDHLKETLKNMKNREKTKEDVERRKQVIREIRHENIERMQKGLPPIYKTRAQIRQLLWEKKSEELKGGKKLEKYLHRRAKKESKRRGANISVGRINERISDASD